MTFQFIFGKLSLNQKVGVKMPDYLIVVHLVYTLEAGLLKRVALR